jgi:hypothetical protein
MTGSITGNTTAAALASAGHFRYNSDETNTNYNTALGGGVNVIYREKPTLTVNVNNVTKTYDGMAYTGGNGFSESTITSGLKNGDSLADSTATAIYGGTAQNAKNADTYILSASETAKNALGYAVTYNSGTLLINKKEVSLSAAKTYDGNTSLTGNQLLIETGIGGETLTYSNATINSKDVKDNASNYVKALTLENGTGNASNYKFIAARGVNNQVKLDKANATVIANSASVNYNGQYQAVSGFTATGLVAGESEQVLTGVSAKRTEKEVGSYTTIATGSDSNYNLNFVPGQFLINKVNPLVNPQQSITPSSPAGSNGSGGGKVIISSTPTAMPAQVADNAKQCSIEHPEACDDCQDALIPGVVFCLVSAEPAHLSH